MDPHFVTLRMEGLEDRLSPSVTAALNAGILTINLGSSGDSAAISVVGANIQVVDGANSVDFSGALTSVSSITATGTSGTNESITVNGALGVNLTASNMSSLTISGFYPAVAANDSIAIDSPAAGQSQISGSSGGVSFGSVTFQNIPTVTINNSAESGNDTVAITTLAAAGLQDLTIKTGSGNNNQFTVGPNVTGSQLSLDGDAAGTNALVISSGAAATLTNTNYTAGTLSVTLANIQSASVSSPSLIKTGFSGTVTTLTSGDLVADGTEALATFPVSLANQRIGPLDASGIVNGTQQVFEQLLQSAGSFTLADFANYDLSTQSGVNSLVTELESLPGNVASGTSGTFDSSDGTSSIDLTVSRTLTGLSAFEIDALGGSISLNGNLDASATVTLNLQFGVDSSGFYITPGTSTAPQLSISDIQVAGSLDATGNFGIVQVSVSNPTLTIDPNVKLVAYIMAPSTSTDQTKIRTDDLLTYGTSLVTGSLETAHTGSSTDDDVVLSFDAQISTALGSIPQQSLVFSWPNVTQPTQVTVGGSGVTYLRQQIQDLVSSVDSGPGPVAGPG